MGADMRPLQLPGPRCPQAFTRVVGIPDIEVPDLRADRGRDPEHMPGRHIPGAAGADRHFELLDQRATLFLVPDSLVKKAVSTCKAEPLLT